MSDTALVKLFEHNNWANQRIIAVCYALSDALLDAAPQSATKGTIRRTLTHLVQAQRRYLQTLTLPQAARSDSDLAFEDLQASARA
ncbi:MAG TPA: DinB family protein, partial [Anaerolineaceae bacterium]